MTSFSTVPHILVSFFSSVNLQKWGKKGDNAKCVLQKTKTKPVNGCFCAQETSQSQESIKHLP